MEAKCELLESNNPEEFQEFKNRFREQLQATRESWLVNGMYEYFINNHSSRAVDILISVPEPHDRHILDKLVDGIRSPHRLQALTLLGYIVQRQPMWLYKISYHPLLRELLRLLKTEVELVTIISALLSMNILIPQIAGYIKNYLKDIFEIFSRLASWNSSFDFNKLVGTQLLHLQISLFNLFHRLYGMFPCSFLSYLKQEYSQPDKRSIFTHTIKPMLESVRVNTQLVIGSKEYETTSQRWKNMEVHDIVVMCSRLLTNSKFRWNHTETRDTELRNDTNVDEIVHKLRLPETSGKTVSKYCKSLENVDESDVWSPSLHCIPSSAPTSIPHTPISHGVETTYIEGSSPPEAAIEATPETTPVVQKVSRSTNYVSATAVRAITFSDKQISCTGNSSHVTRGIDKIIAERKALNGNGVQEDINEYSVNLTDREDIRISHYDQCEEVCGEDGHSHSSCATGGLHMSLPKSVVNVSKHVTRIRSSSQCNSDPYTSTHYNGSWNNNSMDNAYTFLNDSEFKRANSCPEIKKSTVSLTGNSKWSRENLLEEKDEDKDEKSVLPNNNKSLVNVDTQTDDDVRFQLFPYEHLFSDLFKVDTDSSIHDNSNAMVWEETYYPSGLLQQYVDAAVLCHRSKSIVKNRLTYRGPTSLIPTHQMDAKSLSDQLLLLHAQLRFEEHRREVHAERNRRLLGKVRDKKALQEHNAALQDQMALLQSDLDELRMELTKKSEEFWKDAQQLKESASYWQSEYLKLQKESEQANLQHLKMKQQYKEENEKNNALAKDLEGARAALFEATSELQHVKVTAKAATQLRSTITKLQREIMLAGEMMIKYKNTISYLKNQNCKLAEIDMLRETYTHEVNVLSDRISRQRSLLDARRARITALENKSLERDKLFDEQRETYQGMADKIYADLKELQHRHKSTMEMYNKQLEINMSLEHKLSIAKTVNRHQVHNKRSDVPNSKTTNDNVDDDRLGTSSQTNTSSYDNNVNINNNSITNASANS